MLQKVTAVRDDWNVWYVIPDNILDEFMKHRGDSKFVYSGDFNRKYEKYRLGWTGYQCQFQFPLYIEIEE